MNIQEQLKSDLNVRQYEAATFVDGPAVITAGAGAGKTHTLISRVAYLVSLGIPAKSILMLTFTNAAADEIKDRAAALFDKKCADIIACTYHKFCNMMLREYGNHIGIKDYTILSTSAVKNMIDYVKSSDASFDNIKGFPSIAKVAQAMSASINMQQSVEHVLLAVDDLNCCVQYSQEMTMLIDNVRAYGFRNKMFTYDDLLVHMNELLDDKAVCQHIANRYKYIMIDEFQDTNNLQESIILKLAAYNKNIVVVGDISQSIYGFRGANIRNLQTFDTHFSNCKHIVLNLNYRSTQQILDAANAVMSHNHISWNYVDMQSADKSGPKPVIAYISRIDNVVPFLEQLILGFRASGIPYSEIAVLERSSAASFELESMLRHDLIAYDKRGGMKFFDFECIGDMIAFFSIITNRHDILSWFRVLQCLPGIGRTYARRISDNCDNTDFLTDSKYAGCKFYNDLSELSKSYSRWINYDSLLPLFDDISAYYLSMRKSAMDMSKSKDKTANEMALALSQNLLLSLRKIAENYTGIVKFADDILLDSVSIKDASDKLTISTIHSAKGLEWTAVIILNCVEGDFPAHIQINDYGSEKDQEELRCFYVAMTRAKRYLTIVAPEHKMMYKSGIEDCVLSHYLMPCRNSFIEKKI